MPWKKFTCESSVTAYADIVLDIIPRLKCVKVYTTFRYYFRLYLQVVVVNMQMDILRHGVLGLILTFTADV